MKHGQLFIDNEFRDPLAGRRLETVNPATEEVIGTIADADDGDVDRAVLAARRALIEGGWGRSAAPERARVMRRVADCIRRRADELAQIETQDSGKPLYDNLNADVPDAAACFEHFAGWASSLPGSTLTVPFGDFHDYTLREPFGVVAAIAPWNFPLVNAAWKIAPAIAAGNCVVYKPSEEASFSTLVLAEILRDAEVPSGVVQVLTGTGSGCGAALVRHPAVDKISFTGSTETGRTILRASADAIRPCTLELGGKSPNIVFEDCDIEKAVDGAMMAVFYNAGQVCTAGSRLLLQRTIYDSFMDRLTRMAAAIRLGDPMDLSTRMGPLISARQYGKVMDYIEGALRDGSTPRIGGFRPSGFGRGFYVAPTIFERVPLGSRIDREEVFGPVLVVHAFDDEEAAVRVANDTSFGLAAGVWTRDLSRAHRVARQLQAGTVWINTYNVAAVNLPNPAFKQSGIGSELGREGFEGYTRVKNVCIDLGDAPAGYFRSATRS